MTHLSIRIGTADGDPRGAKVVVDGVDITKAVLADGFAVEFLHDPAPHAVVSMRLRIDHLDMDLPEAVLNLIDQTTEV
mgnify:CR=1 FL=1